VPRKTASGAAEPRTIEAEGEIRHADFLIDTSVFGCAADDRRFYERLACQLQKMTAKKGYGKAWIPWTAFHEMIATPDPKRREILGVLVDLYRELGDRIVLTPSLDETLAGEWSEPQRFVSGPLGQLEEGLLKCIRGNGAGTTIDEAGRDFAEWRLKTRAEYDASVEKFRAKYKSDQTFAKLIAAVLENAQAPAIYEACGDIAEQLIEEFAKRERETGLKLAKATPKKYLSTWTFALLCRIAQFAQTIPTEERAKGPFGGYAKLLKSDENDMSDATIVSLGARCGFLITQDGILRERIGFLHAREACRIQAFEFGYIEACWNVPGV
jgi:hypothetical protein